MHIAIFLIGLYSAYQTYNSFQDGVLGIGHLWNDGSIGIVYLAAIAVLVLWFISESDETPAKIGYALTGVSLACDVLPRLWYVVFPQEGAFNLLGLFFILLPVVLNLLFLNKRKKGVCSYIFKQFDEGHIGQIFNSQWFVYSCGALLIYSATYYTTTQYDCFSFFLNILHPDLETPVLLTNIHQWPLAMKIILAITGAAFLMSVAVNLTNPRIKHRVVACMEEIVVTIDLLYILRIYFFLRENLFHELDVPVWIVLDIFIVLFPLEQFFPNTFRAISDISAGIARGIGEMGEDVQIAEELDGEERVINAVLGKGMYTDEELALMGKVAAQDKMDNRLARDLRYHRKRKKKREPDEFFE